MTTHTVSEVMSAPVVTVAATATYHQIVDALVQHAISAVPVVDDTGRVVGVVSEADLLHKLEFAGAGPGRPLLERKRVRAARDRAGANLAADLMSAPPVVIGPGASIRDAAQLMNREGVKRLPVVDGAGRPVGIVSRGDLLRLYDRPDGDVRDALRELLSRTLWTDPHAVTVEVDSGVATLRGTVERRSQVALIELLAQTVPGVAKVVNHLQYRHDDGPSAW